MPTNAGAPRIQFSDGSQVAAFTTFSAHDTFNEPLPHFEFMATPPKEQADQYAALLQKGEFVTLKINDASQGGFLIQTIETIISATGGKTFHVDGISPLVTPYQGSVDPDIAQVHSATDIPVADFIVQVMAPYGFSVVVTDTRASVNSLTGVEVKGRKPATDASKLKHQDAQAQDGETAYQCCAKVFSHLGVCLRMAVEGTLLVGAPDYTQAPIAAVVQGTGIGDRFIGDVKIVDSNDGQFSAVVVRGNRVVDPDSGVTARPASTIAASDVLGSTRAVYRSTPAAYKPKNYRDKQARDDARCTSKAKEILGRTSHKAFQVKGTVGGFVSQTGAVWTVDTVVSVKVDAYGLNENMWVLSRSFHLDVHGAKTDLVLIPLGSLLLGDIPD